MQRVSVDEAQVQLRDLIAAARRGEEVVISDGTNAVQLVARVAPDEGEPKKARRAGSLQGLLVVPDDFNEPLEDFKEYTD
jgi:antitoxin (DNA-binding transcriptional repressor) of toxin-antitoxin stability system